MSTKITWHDRINIGNVFATLILSIVALFVSYNSYKLTVNQSELSNRQLEFELKNSILSLITTSSMLNQSESEIPTIDKSLKAFSEMKIILESQLKNGNLINRPKLADMWTSLLSDVNFNIKFFQEGLKPNTIINGAKDKISNLSRQTSELFTEFNKSNLETEQ